MNGAESLVRTLVGAGVDTCFANPGTSEMHFVAALDSVPGMRCVLCLFEGVVTGAADGYARMADKPACTLLHLGPGLGNGVANLHNARRAFSPIVNVIGDHATYHHQFDAPLTSDIEGLAQPVSRWVKTSQTAAVLGSDAVEAVTAALTPPGQVASLILPADAAWGSDGVVAELPERPERPAVTDEAIQKTAEALRSGKKAALLLTGPALREDALASAGKIAGATGAKLLCQTSNARWQRGAGRVPVERIPYPLDQALAVLEGLDYVILVGAKAPVAFFAYPGRPSRLTPEGCKILTLALPEEDSKQALDDLVDELDAGAVSPHVEEALRPEPPTGILTPESIGQSVAALMPENVIVVDEGISVGRGINPATRQAPPHDWLQLTGGSIGLGLPMAVGAAVACPDRPVLSLQADGSALYTLQALWTQAREGLNITTVIFANRAYESLRHELTNVGAQNPGRTALDMLQLDRPEIEWAKLAESLGVPATRATDAEELNRGLAMGLAQDGPYLVEAVI